MKKILPILLIAAICFACNKDKSSGKQWLLHKVYQNNVLKLEYIYSADKKPQRRNNYNSIGGQSVFTGSRRYQYNANGLLEEVSNFNKDSVLTERYRLQYDLNKRLLRQDYYGNGNTIQYYDQFENDATGKLIRYTTFNAASNKKMVEAQYSYDPQGHPVSIKRYTYSLNNLVLHDTASFTIEKDFPSWWSYYETWPAVALPYEDQTFFEMTFTRSYFYLANTPPVTSEATYTNKIYNQEGLVIKQQVSTKIEGYGSPTVSVIEKTYEYTE